MKLYKKNVRVEPDERDEGIAKGLRDAYHAQSGPMVGDYIRFACGTYHRISHNWGDDVQHSINGSFYLGEGYVEFSGGLCSPVSINDMSPTNETREGRFWFFHHGQAGGHRGVGVGFEVRVWAHPGVVCMCGSPYCGNVTEGGAAFNSPYCEERFRTGRRI